jgi:hypothetical protein
MVAVYNTPYYWLVVVVAVSVALKGLFGYEHGKHEVDQCRSAKAEKEGNDDENSDNGGINAQPLSETSA